MRVNQCQLQDCLNTAAPNSLCDENNRDSAMAPLLLLSHLLNMSLFIHD